MPTALLLPSKPQKPARWAKMDYLTDVENYLFVEDKPSDAIQLPLNGMVLVYANRPLERLNERAAAVMMLEAGTTRPAHPRGRAVLVGSITEKGTLVNIANPTKRALRSTRLVIRMRHTTRPSWLEYPFPFTDYFAAVSCAVLLQQAYDLTELRIIPRD
ncbi:hypothetical protein GCM10012320_08300 [Sinomonas cellulolyticus]|uniref:Uncharacterized protein n=1 Tax=Sinomonas cellulolyticus TaxID=2801916 RepID=A0ABS1K4K1_9MICC|nr:MULTISPECIES: hypothetical protein [Sinomonas]MBL0706292.1 hypothetical protein [Sinomonas cellulolyticus]GHG43891.1 hypothetical protein GCM10012320_08300 [Sinomonas sp. KCTC 49339]